MRIAVAGLGRIGWHFHCREIAQHANLKLAAVQDTAAPRRREAEQTYGVPSFTRFADMIERARPDAVVIATPTHLHAPMALQALRAGCHVLLEKPMAPDAREAAAIVRAAAQRKRVLTVYQPRRASASFQHLRRILDSGAIGEPYHVRIGAFAYARRNDWQSLRRYGGGMLNNYGAHALDQLLQLIGYDIRRVFCSLRLVASLGDADDVVKVVVENRRGAIGEVEINQASAISPYRLQVWGHRGALFVPPEEHHFVIRRLPAKRLPPKKLHRSLASPERRYPQDEIEFVEETIPVDRSLAVDFYANFAAAVRRRAPLFVKPEEPLAVMRLIDRCRADAGRIVRTPPRPSRPRGRRTRRR